MLKTTKEPNSKQESRTIRGLVTIRDTKLALVDDPGIPHFIGMSTVTQDVRHVIRDLASSGFTRPARAEHLICTEAPTAAR